MLHPNELPKLCRRQVNSAKIERSGSLPVQDSFKVQKKCQSGRCINDRLGEHRNSVINFAKHLGIHCRDCGCFPFLEKTEALARSHDPLTQEITEAREMHVRVASALALH